MGSLGQRLATLSFLCLCLFPRPVETQRGRSSSVGHLRKSQKDKLAAEQLTNLQVGLFNFYNDDTQKKCQRAHMSNPTWTLEQKGVRERLYKHAHQFVRATGGEIPAVGRARSKLCRQLRCLSQYHYASNANLEDSLKSESVAVPVDLSRIALPEHAGVVSPERFLCKERREVWRDLQRIIPPPSKSLAKFLNLVT